MKRGQGYWRSIENRKKFFIDYAKQMGFDPNNPWNWQRVTKAHIIAKRVKIPFLPNLGFSNENIFLIKGGALIQLYKGSVRRALEDSFPEWKLQSMLNSI